MAPIPTSNSQTISPISVEIPVSESVPLSSHASHESAPLLSRSSPDCQSPNLGLVSKNATSAQKVDALKAIALCNQTQSDPTLKLSPLFYDYPTSTTVGNISAQTPSFTLALESAKDLFSKAAEDFAKDGNQAALGALIDLLQTLKFPSEANHLLSREAVLKDMYTTLSNMPEFWISVNQDSIDPFVAAFARRDPELLKTGFQNFFGMGEAPDKTVAVYDTIFRSLQEYGLETAYQRSLQQALNRALNNTINLYALELRRLTTNLELAQTPDEKDTASQALAQFFDTQFEPFFASLEKAKPSLDMLHVTINTSLAETAWKSMETQLIAVSQNLALEIKGEKIVQAAMLREEAVAKGKTSARQPE